MIFYDDPRTKLELDYLEVYDIGGDLLLVSWIDRFGVCQVAIDRALLGRGDPIPRRCPGSNYRRHQL